MFFRSIVLLLFFTLSAQGLWAKVPPKNHILYPRDWSVLYLSGIEYSYHIGQIARHQRVCDEAQALLCEISKEVNASDFAAPTLAALVSHQLLFFGERHIDQEPKKLIAKLLKDDPSTIKTLAMEMFNSSSQDKLDQFFAGELNLEGIKKVLEGQWNYNSSGYLAMLEAAKENGTRIVGIDHRDVVEGLHLEFSDELRERDRLMAQVLNRELASDPQQKMIIYTGKLHGLKSLGSELKTVADYIRDQHPTVDELHIMSFNLITRNFLTELYRTFFNDIRSLEGDLLLLPTSNSFTDGVFYFRDQK